MREKIVITSGKRKLTFNVPVTIWQIAAKMGKRPAKEVLAARVNNEFVDVNYLIPCDADVELILPGEFLAYDIYRRTCQFILAVAVRDLKLTGEIIIGQSIENGIYYDYLADRPLAWSVLQQIQSRMQELIDADLPFERTRVNCNQLIEYYTTLGWTSKVKTVVAMNRGIISVYRLGGHIDLYNAPLAPSTGKIKSFELMMYPPGFILRFPDFPKLDRISPLKHQTKLFENYIETKNWYKILGVENVGDLNEKVAAKRVISDLIKISEGLHEKKIAQIADHICKQKSVLRMILIAGPSSSGKTTFAKRLGIQLMVNGLTPVALSLDDYFVEREQTPRDGSGDFDFETIEALDLRLVNDHFKRLLAGEQVELPRFDFTTGHRKKETHPMQLKPGQVLIIEGIHGLNDRLTAEIPARAKFKIFISALTQLRINNLTRISTSDTRLLRRTIRDFRYRGYSAADTIRRWPSVRRGEDRNIFPFQNNADAMFNSALVYELAALKPYALACLETVAPKDREFIVAQRMINFLNLFRSISTEEIPPTSILREFIGGSSFSYK